MADTPADYPELDPTTLAEIMTLLEKVRTLLGDPPALTGKDRIRSTKFPTGGTPIVLLIAALVEQFGHSVAEHSASRMRAKLEYARALVPLQKHLVVALKMVDDAIFLANSESWASASVNYVGLQRTAVNNGTVAEALAPATKFFAERKAKGKKG